LKATPLSSGQAQRMVASNLAEYLVLGQQLGVQIERTLSDVSVRG
jgi:hypothetical protein